MSWFWKRSRQQLTEDCAAILNSIRDTDNITELNTVVDRMIMAGRFAVLTHLAHKLEDDAKGPTWAVQGLFDHLVHGLSLSRAAGGARAVLEIARARVHKTQRWHRELASYLAAGHSEETLIELLDEFSDDDQTLEIFACWIQEHVLRSGSILNSPQVQRFWSKLADTHHPLAALPLSVHALEDRVGSYLPSYTPNGNCVAIPFGPHSSGEAEKPTIGLELRVVSARERVNATASVDLWVKESNGIVESRNLEFVPRLPEEFCPAEFLHLLGLKCLADVPSSKVSARFIEVGDALAILFAGAATGGAYGGATFGAYGRRAAWQSIAALCELDTLDFDTIATEGQRHTWIAFDAPSNWFYGVAWDIGLAAIHPDRSTVAILAASDTD